MNLVETAKLLTVVSANDNRRWDEATVSEWQAMLEDISYPDAVAAVRGHFRDRVDWLMAAMVRERVGAKYASRIDELRKRPPCPHLVDGGDQLHPTSGLPLCPLCRAQARNAA